MYGQTSGVMVRTNSNRLNTRLSVHATNKSKTKKVPASEISKPPGKQFVISAHSYLSKYYLKLTVEKEKYWILQTIGFVKLRSPFFF